MFAWLQHLFTLRAIQGELAQLRLQKESLERQVFELEKQNATLRNEIKQAQEIHAIEQEKTKSSNRSRQDSFHSSIQVVRGPNSWMG